MRWAALLLLLSGCVADANVIESFAALPGYAERRQTDASIVISAFPPSDNVVFASGVAFHRSCSTDSRCFAALDALFETGLKALPGSCLDDEGAPVSSPYFISKRAPGETEGPTICAFEDPEAEAFLRDMQTLIRNNTISRQ